MRTSDHHAQDWDFALVQESFPRVERHPRPMALENDEPLIVSPPWLTLAGPLEIPIRVLSDIQCKTLADCHHRPPAEAACRHDDREDVEDPMPTVPEMENWDL